ncbi:MAG: hypothetical protein ABUL41_00535 [Chitinophagaceae bacterium]
MRSLIFVLGLVLIFSCNNNGTSSEDVSEDSVLVDEEVLPGGKQIWIADYDTIKQQFFLKKQRTTNTDTLTAETLISYINEAWENVILVFNKVSNDTLYVSIPDNDFLAERMGSAGAEAYMASTTYNLTELKGIRFVNYNFKEGDHLSPGVFSRDDFGNFH